MLFPAFIRRGIVILYLVLMACFENLAIAERPAINNNDTIQPVDVGDIIRKVFKKKLDTLKINRPSMAILPSLGYNPSFGFIIGAKISAGMQFGEPKTTHYSVFGLEGMYTSKGIINLQLRHNLFPEGNSWNMQGNWQIAKYGVVDYGLGTGEKAYRNKGFSINEYPTKHSDSAFPIKYTYVRFLEKVYYNIAPKLFAGIGVNFNLYSNIQDQKHQDGYITPHQRYSVRHDFDSLKYSMNGFLFALQYNSREHPIRSYGGIYADLVICFNQEWLGSTRNSIQLQYDLRKYFSLSKRNPEHVLAFWLWASYRLGGDIPYLALPGTATDTYLRSGRAYTLGRFKGPSYSCFETEYRFPITRNKLLSGVCFFNVQSASNDFKQKIYSSFVPGGGAGLRILFQKQSRSTLCVDFAKGVYGSSGIFFGLNEAF
jgi:hypothetical protein